MVCSAYQAPRGDWAFPAALARGLQQYHGHNIILAGDLNEDPQGEGSEVGLLLEAYGLRRVACAKHYSGSVPIDHIYFS
eukprot:4284379-Alexandrium_andersonii.AAC.1